MVLLNLLGIDGIWLSITTGEILSMIMSIYYFMKYRKIDVRSLEQVDVHLFLHMVLIIFSGKAFYNIINFQRIFFVMIYDNGHFLCRFFCLSCLF